MHLHIAIYYILIRFLQKNIAIVSKSENQVGRANKHAFFVIIGKIGKNMGHTRFIFQIS